MIKNCLSTILTHSGSTSYNDPMQKTRFKSIRTGTLILSLAFLLNACASRMTSSTAQTVPEPVPAQEAKADEVKVETDTSIPASDEDKEISVQDIAGNGDSVPTQIERVNELYEEAVKRWDEGDSDAALAAFDSAYATLAQINVDVDSPRAEEKSQLRLMIAQRIQEIYASFASIGGSSQFIALDENQHVQAEIRRFQTVERNYFLESYARSGQFRGMMVKKLRDAGLPEELSWLPMIESGFKMRAYSSARALGLWQFITSTGHRYGLKKDRWVDERMDPEKATDAVVLYFKELHKYFGDWTTALAAYNCGEFLIQRLIRNQKINYFDNFWDLYVMLPRETARFVPRFIATLMIVKDPLKYQMDLPEPLPSIQYEVVRSEFPFKLEQLSQSMSLPSETLADLNPELRHKSTPDHAYDLKVPVGSAQNVELALAKLTKWVPTEVETTVHRIRKGDTISALARKYRTSTEAILRLNNLKKRHTLRIGQAIRIPEKWGASKSVTAVKPVPAAQTGEQSLPQPSGTASYVVKPGDTLFAIARQFQMSVDQLKSLNRIESGTRIYPGQKLWVMTVGGNG